MRSTKVVISDRNDITRKGVEAIIGDSGEPYQVVGVFANLHEAEDYLAEYAAHILILDDQTLTPMEVIRLVTRCHESRPGLGIIVMSPRRDGEYIQRVKIEAAKKSFETSRKNITEVMFDVGYSDTKAFRGIFKKITGMTPFDYRSKYNKNM